MNSQFAISLLDYASRLFVFAQPDKLRMPQSVSLGPFSNREWGDLSDEDRKENNYSLEHGFRLLSAYRTHAGDKLWIITESDRSVTTLLLPEEY